MTPSGIWELEAAEDILPFDLLLEGYPQSASGDHGLVVRVTCTAYTSRIAETDSTPDLTASMKRTRPGYIALSRDLLAEYTPGAPFRFGDRIEIIGKGVYQVEDTMARRWRRRADIWVDSIDEACYWGRRTVLIARLTEDYADVALLDPIKRDGT
jgi:3D (Asp-Asp-Asp) domain-containing protein